MSGERRYLHDDTCAACVAGGHGPVTSPARGGPDTADDEPMRYPADRPGWLGEYQPWPCGRCGREVDDTERHPCPRICTVHGVEH